MAVFDLANLPDADVVALAQQGREPAFREILRRYERPLFSLIYRMVRDRETAEELAQDTFLKALNHIDRYRADFKLSSWLFKIGNNVAIDHLRKRRLATVSVSGAPHAATEAEVEATSFEIASHAPSALDQLESRELGSAIEKAIAALRPEYRSCISDAARGRAVVRGDRNHPGPPARHRKDVHTQGSIGTEKSFETRRRRPPYT